MRMSTPHDPPSEPATLPHTVRVDRDMCQSAATCLAFRVYELDDEVKAVLLTRNGLNSDDPANPLAQPDGTVRIDDLANPENMTEESFRSFILESAKSCPFNAILVHDRDGRQIWPPL
jgi:ferredoxin